MHFNSVVIVVAHNSAPASWVLRVGLDAKPLFPPLFYNSFPNSLFKNSRSHPILL